MGADNFMVVELGRDAEDAFNRAAESAAYDFGHAGYTGTIAEKPGLVYCGEISSAHYDKIEDYMWRYETWLNDERKNRPAKPKGVPPTLIAQLGEAYPVYDDKWGPAVCFQLTGYKVAEIRKAVGRTKTREKVYVFMGWASS